MYSRRAHLGIDDTVDRRSALYGTYVSAAYHQVLPRDRPSADELACTATSPPPPEAQACRLVRTASPGAIAGLQDEAPGRQTDRAELQHTPQALINVVELELKASATTGRRRGRGQLRLGTESSRPRMPAPRAVSSGLSRLHPGKPRRIL